MGLSGSSVPTERKVSEEIAADLSSAKIENAENPIVYFDVTIGKKKPQRIIFELFSHVTPKTAATFLALCTGEHDDEDDTRMFYGNNVPLHRVIPGFVIQGGDLEYAKPGHRVGTGGFSPIYGKKWSDENFVLKHETPYLLSMANAGKDTNGSQFFITLKPLEHLNGKHTVFGKVLIGFDVCKALESVGTNQGTPSKACTIVASGRVKK